MVEKEAPAVRDIVVVGASAGGVGALQTLVAELPQDFPGTVLVVLHISRWAPSQLGQILSRSGPLPASQAGSDQPLEPGRIYVAAPDFHLIVEDHRVIQWKGPAEDRHRPSINTLFRSAAVTYGKRVVGVVLTGALDDGTAGLWWVKRFGGVTVVQDPQEAEFPDMPRSALEHVDVDYVLRVSQMGAFLTDLAKRNGGHGPSMPPKASGERLKWK